jgi:ligand-binding sensor domain-containing protein
MNSGMSRFLLLYALIMLLAAWIAWNPPAARSLWLETASALQSETELVVTEEHLADWSVYDLGADFHQVNLIQHDTTGLMWVATDHQLLHFDGQHWYDCKSQFLEPWPWEIASLGLTSNTVYVGLTRSGRDGGFAVYDLAGEQWSVTLAGEGQLDWGGIRGIATDTQGTVLLPTAGGVLVRLRGERWETVPMPIPFGEAPPLNHAGLLDSAGTYWLATDRGIWQLQADTWTVYPSAQPVTSLATDAQGRLWAGTAAGLLLRDHDGAWYHYPPTTYAAGTNWISAVAVDTAGRIWILTRLALVVFNGQDWHTIAPSVVDSAHWGATLDFDSQGQLWVALPQARIAVFNGQLDMAPFTTLATLPAIAQLPEMELSERHPVPQKTLYPDSCAIRTVALAILVVGVIVGAIRVGVLWQKSKAESANLDYP